MVVWEEGSGVVDTAEGGVLSLCFSRSLKKLVGDRDQVSSHSCVVAHCPLVLWQVGGPGGHVDRPMLGLGGVPRCQLT